MFPVSTHGTLWYFGILITDDLGVELLRLKFSILFADLVLHGPHLLVVILIALVPYVSCQRTVSMLCWFSHLSQQQRPA